jgi:ligand-binding SRPBCC domain-containing protein
MKIYSIKRVQFLPITLAQAWDFFSSPKNLVKITPAKMAIRIQSVSGGDKMYAGQIIKYKIRPLPFITISWVTEITLTEEPLCFVDEQQRGPFSYWRHQHSFKQKQGGVEMTDEIDYAIPLGLLGKLANWLFVRPQLTRLFDYRFNVLSKTFSIVKNVSS